MYFSEIMLGRWDWREGRLETETKEGTFAVLGATTKMPGRKHFRYRLDYRRPRSTSHYDPLISKLIV